VNNSNDDSFHPKILQLIGDRMNTSLSSAFFYFGKLFLSFKFCFKGHKLEYLKKPGHIKVFYEEIKFGTKKVLVCDQGSA